MDPKENKPDQSEEAEDHDEQPDLNTEEQDPSYEYLEHLEQAAAAGPLVGLHLGEEPMDVEDRSRSPRLATDEEYAISIAYEESLRHSQEGTAAGKAPGVTGAAPAPPFLDPLISQNDDLRAQLSAMRNDNERLAAEAKNLRMEKNRLEALEK